MTQKTKRAFRKTPWIVGGALIFAGFLAARLAARFVSPVEGPDIDDNAPSYLMLHQNERRYPPFADRHLEGIQAEGEYDESQAEQLIVIGVDGREFDKAMGHGVHFALARCNGADMWFPAVADKGLWYGKASDIHGEVYAVAVPVGAGALHVVPGTIHAGHFTPFKKSRLLSLTNREGLLYDYPNVPIVRIVEH